MIFQQTIEAKKTKAKRQLKRHQALAALYGESRKSGGIPLSLADLLEWHSYSEAEKTWDPQALTANK